MLTLLTAALLKLAARQFSNLSNCSSLKAPINIPLCLCSSSFCSLVRAAPVAATSVSPSSSPSPSSPAPPAAPGAVLFPPAPDTTLPPGPAVDLAVPPTTEGVCSRALSAFDLRPRFFLGGPVTLMLT